MKRRSLAHSSAALRRRNAGRKSLFVFSIISCLLYLAVGGWPHAAVRIRAERSDASNPANIALAPQQPSATEENLWQEVDERTVNGGTRRAAGPLTYRTLRLNRGKLEAVLATAPLESSDAAKVKRVELTLPLADGTYQSFRIVESPIMEPALAARFPEIKTYRGQGVDDPNTTTRFDLTPTGFHGIVLSAHGTVLLEPYARGNIETHIAYFQRDVPIDSFECGVSEEEQETAITENTKRDVSGVTPTVFSGTNLRTYRLAVAATAEYTQTYGGGTVGGGLAAITTTINLVNAIYEREVAVRLMLIANETAIIFTNAASDGYTSDNAGALIGENQTKLDSVIGAANYDIGHVFDGRLLSGAFGFQGAATLASACRDGVKGRGVNITRSVEPSEVIAYYSAAHEMGHQFSANHTFNASSGSCAQRTPSTAYEPGTGSTIMGYRFTCGTEDMMSSDTYFHHASIEQIVTYTTTGNGSSCPTLSATGNNPPTIDAGASHTIPRSTPFTLTAAGVDPDGDGLTFAWEEYDLGAASPPNTDDGSRPIFRSFAPVPTPSRTFPQLFTILGGPASFESLPVTTRTMNFRVTARDNRSGGGGVNSAATQVNVRADSGPFTVSQPTSGTTWTTNSFQTVTWNVANTSLAPVNCGSVKILLSTDGGNSFPIILANDTANDGSETVTIPGTPTSQARVKVAANGNIFFNISPGFTIVNNPMSAVVQLTAATYNGGEGGSAVSIGVSRTGDTTGTSIVNYATSDTAGLTNCNVINGIASSRCDYATSVGRVSFAAGETSKNISIPIVDDSYAEGNENFTITLSNATGSTLGTPNTATVTINDNEATNGPNPIDQTAFFVRQHYIDFLSREPDPQGFADWQVLINNCPPGNTTCDRIHVSSAFFRSLEFQERGYFVYRFYSVSFGRKPDYVEFIPDLARVSGFLNAAELEAAKVAFVNDFMLRPAFANVYNPLNNTQYVDTLLTTAGITHPARNFWITALGDGTRTRAQVLREIAESGEVYDKYFNQAFVVMQYFGYLRRDPDAFYLDWIVVLDTTGDFRGMVSGFMNGAEYRFRFGP